MKAIMVMYDSLNRHMLPPYGCDWVHAPNFTRLAEKTLVFASCTLGATTSCTAPGGRWSRSMTRCLRSCRSTVCTPI
mgnify:CR=1 FL=1